jgi:hypothetical protein
MWLAGYAATMALLVGGLLYARETLVPRLSTPEAQAAWQQWQAEAQRQTDDGGPVARRPPKSPEPPTLILLRDHFVACLGGAVLFGSSLFFVVALFIGGMLRSRRGTCKSGVSQ